MLFVSSDMEHPPFYVLSVSIPHMTSTHGGSNACPARSRRAAAIRASVSPRLHEKSSRHQEEPQVLEAVVLVPDQKQQAYEDKGCVCEHDQMLFVMIYFLEKGPDAVKHENIAFERAARAAGCCIFIILQ